MPQAAKARAPGASVPLRYAVVGLDPSDFLSRLMRLLTSHRPPPCATVGNSSMVIPIALPLTMISWFAR